MGSIKQCFYTKFVFVKLHNIKQGTYCILLQFLTFNIPKSEVEYIDKHIFCIDARKSFFELMVVIYHLKVFLMFR